MIDVERQGPVGTLRIRRPEKANAYDAAHLDQLAAGIAALDDCGVVVVLAAGRSFCAGADLDELRTTRAAGDWRVALGLRSQAIFTMLSRSRFVSIASVQGPAVAGGFELALACDLRVVGAGARFSLPETSLGIVPSAGGLTRLARLCSVSVAKGVVLGGRVIDAQEAGGGDPVAPAGERLDRGVVVGEHPGGQGEAAGEDADRAVVGDGRRPA